MLLKCLQLSLLIEAIVSKGIDRNLLLLEPFLVEAYDLTKEANFEDTLQYYNAVDKKIKMCDYCGYPDLGTVMHLQHGAGKYRNNAPGELKMDNLVTRLQVVNVTHMTRQQPRLALTREQVAALPVLAKDPREPTLLLFHFGWTPRSYHLGQCNCSNPGLTYQAAEWIASNLGHVTGVATDTPSLESDETRDEFTNNVANVLGKSGIYMIENVIVPDELPVSSCTSMSMPLKMKQPVVPTRLIAYCPSNPKQGHTIFTVSTQAKTDKIMNKFK